MKRKTLVSVFTVAAVFLFASLAFAAPFTATKSTAVLAAPGATDAPVASLASGAIVEVTHQAGTYWRVQTPDGKTGYVQADALQQTKTKGLFLPIMIAAATPFGKIVIAKAVSWFMKLFGLGDAEVRQADGVLAMGKELLVLAKEVGGWLKVKDESGQVGYVKEGPQGVYLQPVGYADNSANQYDWMLAGAKPIPATANGLTLQVEVRKSDGTPVIPGQTALKLGDEYDVYVSASADAYVRVTAETKGLGNVCQYYPNHMTGTRQSALFKAGYTYSAELLPQGTHFKVSEPIGAADVIRVEATTAAPFHFVPKPQGCTPLTKGPGFGSATGIQNPTPQVVVEFELKTVK